MIWPIFISFAAIFNAVMDSLEEGKFNQSIFGHLNVRVWYKPEAWKYSKKIFNYPCNPWHYAKTLMIISVGVAVLYAIISGTPRPWYIILGITGLSWMLPFNLFFNHILKREFWGMSKIGNE